MGGISISEWEITLSLISLSEMKGDELHRLSLGGTTDGIITEDESGTSNEMGLNIEET